MLEIDTPIVEIFERIRSQVEALRLPLFAVTLTALPRPNLPAMLVLHWHGFAPESATRGPGQAPRAAIPSSALQINAAWADPAHWDALMLDAAWQCGAWELDREERRACMTIGAGDGEAIACRRAFADGGTPGIGRGLPELFVIEAPDQEDMLKLGARLGYVQWRFRPVLGGVWTGTSDDATLGAQGGREPPCPHSAQDLVGTRVSRFRYRLGSAGTILRTP